MAASPIATASSNVFTSRSDLPDPESIWRRSRIACCWWELRVRAISDRIFRASALSLARSAPDAFSAAASIALAVSRAMPWYPSVNRMARYCCKQLVASDKNDLGFWLARIKRR